VVFANAKRHDHDALGTVDHSGTRTELTVGAHLTADAHPGTHHDRSGGADAHPGTHHDVTGSTGAVAHTHVTTGADPHTAAQHLNAGPVADDVYAAACGRLGQLRLQLPDRHLERRRVFGRLLGAGTQRRQRQVRQLLGEAERQQGHD
jgi:hypothetical protein